MPGFARVSVIIPSLNSPLIADTVDSVLRQSAVADIEEVLVIGRDEPTLIPSDRRVHFIDTERPVTAPVARNIGIGHARAPVLAFIDADCLASPQWLQHLLGRLLTGSMVVGGSVAFPANPYLQLCYNVTMFHEFRVTARRGTRANMGTLNLCIDRGVVERVGLMDERLDRGQDTEWTLRMRRHGYTLDFEPDAAVIHLPVVQSLHHLLRTWYKSGMYNAWIRREYHSLIAPAPFDGRPWLQKILAPVIAVAVTARIFGRDVRLLRYLHTFPVVFATKVAWCWGASRDFEPGPL